jgi:hypothetical protein
VAFSLPFDIERFIYRISNDFRFDDAMATLGCEVHSFDPR